MSIERSFYITEEQANKNVEKNRLLRKHRAELIASIEHQIGSSRRMALYKKAEIGVMGANNTNAPSNAEMGIISDAYEKLIIAAKTWV